MSPNYQLRLVELLTRLVDGQERIIKLLQERRRPAPTRDPVAAAALLRAIHQHVRERHFTTFDICDHVDVADAVELGEAITAACGALSARSFGKLLKAFEGQPLEGLRVVRCGAVRQGIQWRVEPASLRVSSGKSRAFA